MIWPILLHDKANLNSKSQLRNKEIERMSVEKQKNRGVYLTDTQYAAIYQFAESHGEEFSSFMRRIALREIRNAKEREALLASGG